MVRVKHRYLVAQILYPEAAPKSSQTPPSTLSFRRPTPPSITSAHLIRLIRNTILEVFGDYGAGVCAGSLFIKYYSGTTSTLIIRCARERARLVWTALTLITNLPAVVDGRYRDAAGPPCVFRVVYLSGTIRKSEEKIIQMARNDILLMRKADGSTADDVLLALGGAKEGIGEGSVVMADVNYDEDEEDEAIMSDSD